jgi:predicted ester cyclase
LLSACGGGDAPNVAPVSNAGVNQTVATASVVTLDGSGSFDANGDPLTYQWTLSSKPTGSAAVLSSATSAKPTFTADAVGNYVLGLVANDGRLSGPQSTVTIAAKQSAKSNEATLRKVFSNNDIRDFDANLPLFATNFVGHNFAFPNTIINGNKDIIHYFRETEGVSFPDGKHTIYTLLADDTYVNVDFAYIGTFSGDLTIPPLPANNKVITFHYNMLVRFSEGKIVEVTWFSIDAFQQMVDLGLLKFIGPGILSF